MSVRYPPLQCPVIHSLNKQSERVNLTKICGLGTHCLYLCRPSQVTGCLGHRNPPSKSLSSNPCSELELKTNYHRPLREYCHRVLHSTPHSSDSMFCCTSNMCCLSAGRFSCKEALLCPCIRFSKGYTPQVSQDRFWQSVHRMI